VKADYAWGRALRIVGPGMLVAATGVGAGDLATAAFAGNKLGLAVLWAVVLGAGLKFVLNEGLARWQLATGTTLLEGCVHHLGRPFTVLFGVYLVLWSYVTGAAMMSACGATLHAILPVFEAADTGKFVFGVACSAAGLGLVLVGGYRLFERVMAVCIGIMFFTVVITAIRLAPDWGALARGLTMPAIPDGGLGWTVALIGGIGGTLTVLCYGYWIRNEGREGLGMTATCRMDLAAGYVMTAVFGVAMVVVGSAVVIPEGARGANLIVAIADRLHEPVGTVGKWAFLIGAFGAVFSSLFGVWQAAPYIFADFVRTVRGTRPDSTETRGPLDQTRAYRIFLVLIATVPIVNLRLSFASVQQTYAVFGACFMPFLAMALLYLNNRGRLVGGARNSWLTNAALIGILSFFTYAGWLQLSD